MSAFVTIQKGKYKKKKIEIPPPSSSGHQNITPSIVKEASFQIFQNIVEVNPEECAFTDLCCGSGQIGLEALSRGYMPVHMVELDKKRFSFLAKSMQNFKGEVTLHNKDFQRMDGIVLQYPHSALFLDPPYSFWNKNDCPHVRIFLDKILLQISTGTTIYILIQGPDAFNPINTPPPDSNISIETHIHNYGKNTLTAIKIKR